MKRTYSISEARKRLPSLVRDAERGAAIALTRRGSTVAVLVSTDRYSKLAAKKKVDLGEAIDQFRRDFDLAELNIAEIYEGVRDKTPGRDVAL
jgi:prevent-host-death family protein